jgi:hypothetical protein
LLAYGDVNNGELEISTWWPYNQRDKKAN